MSGESFMYLLVSQPFENGFRKSTFTSGFSEFFLKKISGT